MYNIQKRFIVKNPDFDIDVFLLQDNKSIKLKHFLGMMKHLRPKKSK